MPPKPRYKLGATVFDARDASRSGVLCNVFWQSPRRGCRGCWMVLFKLRAGNQLAIIPARFARRSLACFARPPRNKKPRPPRRVDPRNLTHNEVRRLAAMNGLSFSEALDALKD